MATHREQLDERADEIEVMRQAGMSYDDIADCLDVGIPGHTISEYWRSTESQRLRRDDDDHGKPDGAVFGHRARVEIDPLLFHGLDPSRIKETWRDAAIDFIKSEMHHTNLLEFARRNSFAGNHIYNIINDGRVSDEYLYRVVEALKCSPRWGPGGRMPVTDAFVHRVKCHVRANGTWGGLARAAGVSKDVVIQVFRKRRTRSIDPDLLGRIEQIMDEDIDISRRCPGRIRIPMDFAKNLQRMGWSNARMSRFLGVPRETLREALRAESASE